ncbi:MAG: class II aldolase/adducin family protein [Stappiaceae bacterium]
MSAGERERQQLNEVSARLGSDAELVQAAGGNTSVKQNGVMWIKASGTWLMHANEKNIMVPVDLDPLLEALGRNDPAAEKAQGFVIESDNPSGLRPSIETTVHAVFDYKFVLHVHCIQSIAVAVLADAEAVLAKKLAGLNWKYVPYVRPGLPLSRSIAEVLSPDTNVVILGNHGLVVAGNTLDEAERLIAAVRSRLTASARKSIAPDVNALKERAESGDYVLPRHESTHLVATDLISCDIARRGSLYPDHVIFLGAGSVVAQPDEGAAQVCQREVEAGKQVPVSILFPGLGILMNRSANVSAHAMAQCLSDVVRRIPKNADLRYLTYQEDDALLNWDAEIYRQALSKKRSE